MSEKALDKQIETLRALLGQDKDSKVGLSKPKPPIDERIEPRLHSESTDNTLDENLEDKKNARTIFSNENEELTEIKEDVTDQIKPLPMATKTFTPRDFLHFKKHSNEQSLVLIKRFLSKHGKPEENSSELQALTSAISRIISKSTQKESDNS